MGVGLRRWLLGCSVDDGDKLGAMAPWMEEAMLWTPLLELAGVWKGDCLLIP